MGEEFIVCSAINIYGRIFTGYRHADCYEIAYLIYPNHDPQRPEQGFLTSHKRFVNRKEAWVIAKANNQVRYGLEASENGDESELTSENLYM